jgi:hypothetical protein
MSDKPMDFNIIVGDFKFDFFLTDSGSLGFTVTLKDGSDNFVDIFVNKNLSVIHC